MKKPKKILYIINHKSFFVSHRLKIAMEAKKQKLETFLICGTDASLSMKNEAKKILKKKKINFKEIYSDPSKFNMISDIKYIYKTYIFLKRYNPDLIHIASPKSLMLGGIAARIYNKSAVVLSISGLGHLFTEKNLKTKILSFLFVKIIRIIIKFKKSIVIVQNKEDYRFFQKLFKISKKKVKIIKGSGVDLNKFYPKKNQKKKLILFPGRLLLNKGILEFYESAKIINKKHKDWKFLIAGASDYNSPVLIKKYKLREILKKNYIKYLGHVDYKKMPKILNEVSIMCLPSYREGMPMALQEGSSSGLPIITSNVTGCNEVIINNKTGFLVKLKSIKMLVEKLLLLIENKNLRKKFGKEGRKFAIKNFDERLIIKQNLDIYKKLISNGKYK